MGTHHIKSPYLGRVVHPKIYPYTVTTIAKSLLPYTDKFDGIAFVGMSGAMVGPAVGVVLQKPFLMVRKKDNSHSSYTVEGDYNIQRYIIVDDRVCSGNTLRYAMNKIHTAYEDMFKDAPEFVGLALYADNFYLELSDIKQRLQEGVFGNSTPENFFLTNCTQELSGICKLLDNEVLAW
jgi:hypothetical protein